MLSCRQYLFVFHLLVIINLLLGTSSESAALGSSSAPTQIPLVKVADLNVGESQTVELHDGSKIGIKLLTRDSIRNAVRRAVVTVKVNAQTISLVSSTYHLPVTAAGVQIDCPVTKGYLQRSSKAILSNSVGSPRTPKWLMCHVSSMAAKSPAIKTSTITMDSTSEAPRVWSMSLPPPMD
ncbi:MAG: hypothetical protein ACYS30_25500 [Planctomycetota bacterium]